MKQRTKRVVTAWFMSLLMVLSVVMIPGGVVKADAPETRLKVVCQDDGAVGGTVSYKFDEGGETDFTITDNRFNDVSIPENAESVVLKIKAADGYKLETVRGVTIRVDGEQTPYRLSDDQVAQITSDTGYTYTLNGNIIELEFGFKAKESVKVGTTVVVEEGVIKSSVEGISVSEDGTIKLNGCDFADKDLIISGSPRIEVYGNNKFKSIKLTKGSGFEMWGRMSGNYQYDDMPEVDANNNNLEPYYGNIQLTDGISGPENGLAGRISFRDAFILYVGTSDNPANVAFRNLDSIEFWNYDFHDRKANNGYIYANTAFKNVKHVEVQSAKIKVEAITKLFDKDSAENSIVCNTFQEGVIEMKGDLGDVALKNKYYATYPADNGKSGYLAHHDNAGDAGSPYVQTVGIDTSATVDNSTPANGSYKLTVGSGTYKLESTDSILYSISYTIDDGIAFDNPNAGSVKMDGFNKGYWIIDDRDGHFEAWIAAGENVNVTILPNAGYQYIKNTLNINGAPIETKASVSDDDVGKYSFTMPANAGHVCAGFAKTEDVIKVNSEDTNVSAATLSLDESEIKQGNAKLEIDKAEVTDNDKAKISAVVPDANENTVYEYMDVTLSESVVKNYDTEKENDEQTAWDKKLSELNEEATITLTLSDVLRGFANYDIVRIHEGVAEKLNGVSIMSGGRLSFKTDKFSTYAIVGKNQPLYVQNGVDCSELKSGSYTVDGDTVTIDNLVQDVDAEYGELCLYGKEYGKTPMTLIVKGTNKVKNLIFDTKVNVICEKDASLSFEKGDFEGEFKTGGYTLGKDTVLEGNVFKYKSSETPQPQPQPAQQQPVTTVTPEPTPATPSEVGTEITTVEAAASQSTYEVTQKSTGSDGEVSYKGEATDSKATTVKILDTVTGKDGVTYKVTEIAENALKGNKKVKTVTMGKNIKVVRKNAFRNASKLTTVKLGDNVTKIEGNAFNGCKKLKSLTVKGKITSVGKNAFKGVGKNTTITIVCKSKKEYKKIKKLLEKAGAKKAKFKHKKK